MQSLAKTVGGPRDARIMVSNTSGDPVTADVSLGFQGGRHASATITLGQGSNADTGSTDAAPIRRMKANTSDFLSYSLSNLSDMSAICRL